MCHERIWHDGIWHDGERDVHNGLPLTQKSTEIQRNEARNYVPGFIGI